MADLIVFAFENEEGAGEMRDELIKLQKQQLIELEDAAVVIRKQDGKVKVKQVASLAGAGALGGAFWGMLIGLLFWAPWLGLAIGAVTGAVAGGLTDIGVDDKFIKEVGEPSSRVTRRCSSWFARRPATRSSSRSSTSTRPCCRLLCPKSRKPSCASLSAATIVEEAEEEASE